MGKVLHGLRFEPEVFGEFKRLASLGGYTVTGAFERFMGCCLAQGALVFPASGTEGVEAEARVLVDWLRKGKRFYHVEAGNEVNVPGRLICLLSRICDASLRAEVELELKRAVSE